MSASVRKLAFAILASMTLCPLAEVRAQYNPYNPYYPGYYGGFGPGSTLQGQASVISATGDLITQQEQARVTREQANQAKLQTKKMAFDENLYEKAMTPTFTEEMNKNQSMLLRRIMTNPLDAEVTQGKAHNIMLPVLNSVALHGAYGPPIHLDQDMLRNINVTGTGSEGAGVGMLKNDGRDLPWPIALVGSPTQKKMAEVLPKAVAEVRDGGQLTLGTYNAVNKAYDELMTELKTKFHKEEIDGAIYLEGKRFMDSLQGSVSNLRLPSAAQYFNGGYSAQGRTVLELIMNMSKKGLKFAPCNPGYEAPYFALYNAMVAYASGSPEDPSGLVSLQSARYPQSPKSAWK